MHSTSFAPPPRLRTAHGDLRRVGVEIEFGGPGVEEAAAIVVGLYGGAIEPIGRYGVRVRDTALGDFRVELDSAPLKEGRVRELLERIPVGLAPRVLDAVEDALATIACAWVPREIVSPPVPIHELRRLEALREALCAHHAEGTRVSPFYTFGFQLNPEVPALDAPTLLAHLQSFLLLYDWLLEASRVDVTRRLGPFIDAFPEAYRRRVVDPSYAPDLEALVDDYLAATPTRNRPLDMLPVFAHVLPDRVRASAREPSQVHARPTFHYRLPNSLVDDAAWTFAEEWNRWVEVERLAADDDARAELGEAFLASVDEGDPTAPQRWAKEVALARALPR